MDWLRRSPSKFSGRKSNNDAIHAQCLSQLNATLAIRKQEVQASLTPSYGCCCDDNVSHCSEESGLDAGTSNSSFNSSSSSLKPLNQDIAAPRIDGFRFSMANLEDSPEVDLDAILGELCALETQCEQEIGNARDSKRQSDVSKAMSARISSDAGRLKMDDDATILHKTDRTDSPDNDSAFSDTVSMLSSESSASSGGSNVKPPTTLLLMSDEASRVKAEKIRMAMEKIKEANIQKLFVKVFTMDGSAKSLLVDEKMTCAYVTRTVADKNHVAMDPKWGLVEHLPDLYMERVYEDDELLVDNLMLWTRDSKNKIYFAERPDKTMLFMQPERFILGANDRARGTMEHDEHARNLLLEEFFSSNVGPGGGGMPEVEGPLYLKSDSKKGWKKYHFVLRASGLYYVQKEKQKSAKDLVCLATFDVNQIYYGIGWKKKFKAPTDYCFAIKHPRLQEPKSTKYIKYLCCEDKQTLDKWMVGMRIAKVGKQLMENYRFLVEELAQEDLDLLAHARSCSVSSIPQSNVTTPCQGYAPSEGYMTQSEACSSTPSEISSGRQSRASSSSSSGCMSDGAPSSCENAFDSEFPTGTIKRKPSMKPTIPLTNITRQLKEVGETRDERDETDHVPNSPSYTNNGTLTRRHSRRKSSNSDEGSMSGTLKRQHSYKRGSIESVSTRSGDSCGCSTPIERREFIRSPLSPLAASAGMSDSLISLPPPPPPVVGPTQILTESAQGELPPPPPELYCSTTSLDSLPPPPNPGDLPSLHDSELTGSQLSLMSLPPLPQDEDTLRQSRHRDSNNCTPTNSTPVISPETTPTVFSPVRYSSNSNCSTPTSANPPGFHTNGGIDHAVAPIYGVPQSYRQTVSASPSGTFNNTNGLRSSLRMQPSDYSSCRRGNSITSPVKTKKISFNLVPQEAPALLPRKPTPPQRSENTRLSSPKKLADPPVDFLKEIQRVMRKKWQVAQKCLEEPNTTPHEVLGFRDPPATLPDYKETNVSNWVQEHYGPNNFYENVYRDAEINEVAEYSASPLHVPISKDGRNAKRPPPPPPKRSETTHLSTKLH